jgi:hypothetical protein
MTLSRIVPLALFSLGVAACDPSDTSDKPLNELTDEEYVAACEESLASIPDGALEGLLRYQCASATCPDGGQTAFEECLDTSELLDCDVATEEPIDDCAAPTSVYATCFEALLEQFVEYADDTCDSPLGMALPISQIPACADFLDACPDVFAE